MAAKKVGELIKEARANAGLTQAELGRKVGLSASDIGKAERGEKTLTQADLKAIAKATGVTQTSLLNAPGAKAKTTAKTSAKTSGKTSTSSGASMKLTATEKKLVELYRAADAETKKEAMNLLKGEKNDLLEGLLGSLLGDGKKKESETLFGNLGNILELLNKK